MMSKPEISAVICSYNRYDVLGEAIESLQAQSLPVAGYEIIVVDNSPDHDFSETFSKDYRGIENLSWIVEKVPGLSNARNVGTRLAKGRFVAFMDDDAVASPSWLDQIVTTFDEFGDRARVVGGRVDPIWEAPRPRWLHDAFLGHLSVVNWDAISARATTSREWLAGTNISFSVDALNKAGGFSTQLGRNGGSYSLLSNEETEVCEKIKETGGLVIYSPTVIVNHRVAVSRLSQEWFRRRIVWQAVSDYGQNGKELFEKAPQYWKSVLHFVNMLPPRDRSLRSLYISIDDPDMFNLQMSALYNYTIALLSGFNNIET